MRKTLLKMYHELKESGSVSDFPYLLGNTMHKLLLDKFKGINSEWRKLVMKSTLSDFKTTDRVIVSEAPDLLKVEPQGPYKDSNLRDYRYQVALETWGRTFSIGRNVIINDDLNSIQKQPQRFGRAAARTLVKQIVDALEGDHVAYDGTRLFANGRSNFGTVALANTTAGAAAVAEGILAIEGATDPFTGEKMGLRAKYLVVPLGLKIIAQQLIRSAQILPVSTTGGGAYNAISSLEIVVETWLTSTTRWYIFADPNDCPVIDVGFLDGKETPDLLMKKAEVVNLAGGDDPFGYEFDDIHYKVRHDWDVALAYYQGVYCGNR